MRRYFRKIRLIPCLSDPPPSVGFFNKSKRVTVNNSQFQAIGTQHNHYDAKGKGLEELYRASMPEAAHNASAREYPSKCYPGTRVQHIKNFTSWTSNSDGQSQRRLRVTWREGAAGAGKSAIAQTCAEKLGDGLGAAFFFSRQNQRDDPDPFVPSIAYQISTKVAPFATILDEKIHKNPSLLTKTMEAQFRELIVLPFLELKEGGVQIQDRVVIIDRLDECRDDRAQRVIIELIATAVREHGKDLPFLWAFFSRPEPHIVQTFSSEAITPLVWTMSLPVSREIDGEIERYIRGEFEKIRKRMSHVPFWSNAAWPSDPQVSLLVHKSAGLFVHASTTMKYIGDPEALDPRERLNDVLSLPSPQTWVADHHPSPTAELDSLYTLLMQRIPAIVLPIAQQILLLHEELRLFKYYEGLTTVGKILGLDLPVVAGALSKLHSVLRISEDSKLQFYHASFMEFLLDTNRSGSQFCIRNTQHYEALLKRATEFIGRAEASTILGPLESPRDNDSTAYAAACRYIPSWLELVNLEGEVLLLLAGVNFKKHHHLWIDHEALQVAFNELPRSQRDQAIWQYKPPHG